MLRGTPSQNFFSGKLKKERFMWEEERCYWLASLTGSYYISFTGEQKRR